jgi:hypothetical protein
MRVQNIQTGEIFKVVINHSDGYEFGGSSIRHNKENYEVLPELEPDPLMGMTEEEYIDAYGSLPY